MLCFDLSNEYSYISFGDAWLPELMTNEEGISMPTSRTKMEKKTLQYAKKWQDGTCRYK